MNKKVVFTVNEKLIWDYDFKGNYNTGEFKRWYISRVLTCGTKDDLLQLGITAIKEYFPSLNLSNRIRQFWEWYFNYAHIH